MNRRNFISRVLETAAVVVIAPKVFAEQKRPARPSAGGGADTGAKLVDEKSPGAKALHFAHNKKDIKDASLKTDRNGVAWANQQCSACSFYTKTADDKGACTIFSGQLVKATGWCTSWSKKA